jgi:hypothetical protein
MKQGSLELDGLVLHQLDLLRGTFVAEQEAFQAVSYMLTATGAEQLRDKCALCDVSAVQ